MKKDQMQDPLSSEGKTMPLLEHLGELRTRLVCSLWAVIALFLFFLYFASPMINFLKEPLAASLPTGVEPLHFTGPLEVLFADMKVAFLAAIIAGSPVWLYQFWKFLEPGLYPSERRLLIPFTFVSVVLFLLGVCLSYYAIIPLSLTFLLNIGLEVAAPVITVSDYLSLLIIMILGFGLIFETPLILILLASLGVINAQTLKSYRKYTMLLILVVSAILTPPDPISQVLMAVPLYMMYEISVFIVSYREKKKTQQTA